MPYSTLFEFSVIIRHMKFIQRINPQWALRLGLGLMYLYSGSDLFYNPQHWYGFAPQWFMDLVTSFVSMDTYLRIQGIGEFVLGLLFLAWFSGKWGVRIASLIATVELASILLFVGADLVTFRDIGLLGAALALLIVSLKSDSTNPPYE